MTRNRGEVVQQHGDGKTVRRRQKAVLTCRECSHESPVDGDWSYHGGTTATLLHCPECGLLVARRLHFDDSDRAK